MIIHQMLFLFLFKKSETELQAFPTQWSAQAANSNG